jgi:oligopeptide transport system substrate-binding protein
MILRCARIAVMLCFALPAQAQMIFHRGETGDPSTLDPHRTSTVTESNILLDLFEGLIANDARGNLIPGVAESWSISTDARTYHFTLRNNARWSNGEAITADDFVFSFRRLLDPATAAEYANLFSIIKNAGPITKGEMMPETLGVRALDARTLEITLERPTPYFLSLLAHQTAVPLHRASVEKYGRRFVRPENMVSNGAFMLKDFNPNDRLVLAKNPHFHDAKNVALDFEIFHPIEDRSAGLRRFIAGEIDAYNDVPADQVNFVRQKLGPEFRVAPYVGTYYFAFDTRKKPFDDARVRRALSMVIDREFLAETIWSGTMEPAYSFVPPDIANYGKPSEVSWKSLSPFAREDAAKALLKQAGYGAGGKPLKIEIRYNTSESHKATSIAIADMWKALGVETTLHNTDGNSHYAYLREKSPFDVARAGWIGDYADAQNFLFLAESENRALNYSNYNNPAFDALMRAASETADTEKRKELLHKAEALLVEDAPNLLLLTYRSRNLVSKKLRGWEPNSLDQHPGRYISFAPR